MTQALGNITSANAVLVLGVEELYPVGVQLTNFATDQMLSSDDMEIAQARMGVDGGHRDAERSDLVGQRHGVGVDGGLAAGYVPNPFSLTIALEASSPSLTVMQSLLMAMKTNRTTYKCSVTLTIPSIKHVHFWRNGVLTNGNPVTAPKKTLDPTSWKFVFQDYYTAGFNAGV